jgi:hypothetical protein
MAEQLKPRTMEEAFSQMLSVMDEIGGSLPEDHIKLFESIFLNGANAMMACTQVRVKCGENPLRAALAIRKEINERLDWLNG